MFTRSVLMTALMWWIGVGAIMRGLRPGLRDSRKWYARTINATGGIVILLFWVFLVYFVRARRSDEWQEPTAS